MDKAATDVLAGWSNESFTRGEITRLVYRRGRGPGIIVIHEIPGITPKVTHFANELVDAGFTVVMPSLLGTPGKPPSTPYILASVAKLCVAGEFTTWALNRTSPIIDWLRALGRQLHGDVGGAGIGAVGMCFSGGFALGMMLDECMVAPVLSQPSLPLAIGQERAANLNLSPADLQTVQQRAMDGCQVLGLRFTEDGKVGTRFETLRSSLGDAFVAIELPSNKPSDHSVLTEQRDDASVVKVIDFFKRKLLAV